MRKLVIPALLALALVGAQTATAASTLTISIKKAGFSPKTSTLAFGSTVTWKNTDTTNHQVVANDGSFASAVLAPGKSYTFTFNRAGKFNYHDALHPTLTGTLTINGPPPALTLALDKPILVYGTQLALSGKAENILGGTSVTLYAQEWTQPSPVQLAVVQTNSDGSYGYLVTPKMYTTYTASFTTVTGTVKSNQVFVQVAPKVSLLKGSNGYLHALVKAGKSMAGRHLFLQRQSKFGQWVNIATIKLGSSSGATFRPSSYLPKGTTSKVRLSLSVNQAGIGLLGATSGTQTVTRKA